MDDFYNKDCDDPLAATRPVLFSDGPPAKIHGEPDLSPEMAKENLWGGKPPVPIEHL